MSNRAIMFAAIIFAATPVSGAFAAEKAATAGWNYIEFETQSWGRTLSSWAILDNGSGSWRESKDRPGAAFGDYDIVFHDIAENEAGFAELRAILKKLPAEAPDFNTCRNFMTDAPYGKIRLTRGVVTTEIAWNSGCMDRKYQKFLSILQATDQKVAAWGKSAPILRTERSVQQGQ
jgi:hypothetical protein